MGELGADPEGVDFIACAARMSALKFSTKSQSPDGIADIVWGWIGIVLFSLDQLAGPRTSDRPPGPCSNGADEPAFARKVPYSQALVTAKSR